MSDQENTPTEAENQAETETQEPENQILTPKDGEQQEAKPINQEAVEKRINKITFEKNEERRKRELIEQQLNEIQAKLDTRQAASENIEIPELPDVYDDDFDTKLKAREEALARAAAAKERNAILKEQQQKAQMDEAKAQNAKIAEQVDAMYSSAKELGINKEELEQADKTVSQFISDPSLAKFILAQKDSALIVKYLSSSAVELEKLRNMDSLNASVRIATKIASEASKLKPGVTRTPDPLDIPSGKATSSTNPYLKGVLLE